MRYTTHLHDKSFVTNITLVLLLLLMQLPDMLAQPLLTQKYGLALRTLINLLAKVKLFVHCQISRPLKLLPTNITRVVLAHMRAHGLLCEETPLTRLTL